MCFPLYDILMKETECKKISREEMYKLSQTINELEHAEQEIVYILIRIHHLKNEKNMFEIPYKGINKNGKDIKFNLEKMPEQLISILYEFTNKHSSSVKEKIVSPYLNDSSF